MNVRALAVGPYRGQWRVKPRQWRDKFRWCQVREAIARSRQRQQLAALSDVQLKDMGISRHDACVEAAKPFWID